MPTLDVNRRKDAARSILDGASYLLSPVGDPSLRPLAATRAVSADHAALLADWLVSGLDLRQAAFRTLRQHDAEQGRLFPLDAANADNGNGGPAVAA
jgi:hypothetical protein